MNKVLVMGGTRFFGKRLVWKLLESGKEVTLATRGRAPDDFGDRVKRLVMDRNDPVSLRAAALADEWDVVYDHLGYSPQNAADACEAFSARTGRYIFVSTRGVYEHGPARIKEEQFDPITYPVRMGGKSEFSYEEGKRLAEAVLFQNVAFPAAAVRIPIVLGDDDYTRRLHFHIEHVRSGKPIGVPNLEVRMSFIDSEETASFLAWLGTQPRLTGPVNACAAGEVTMRDILDLIEEAVGRKAIVRPVTAAEHMSPFAIKDSYFLDTSKAQAAGYRFRPIGEWLPALIRELAKENTGA